MLGSLISIHTHTHTRTKQYFSTSCILCVRPLQCLSSQHALSLLCGLLHLQGRCRGESGRRVLDVGTPHSRHLSTCYIPPCPPTNTEQAPGLTEHVRNTSPVHHPHPTTTRPPGKALHEVATDAGSTNTYQHESSKHGFQEHRVSLLSIAPFVMPLADPIGSGRNREQLARWPGRDR